MLETIKTFFIAYWYIVLPIISTLFLCIPLYIHWEKIRYIWMNFRFHLPLIGKIRYWIKNPGEQDSDTHFLGSERDLCEAYYHYYEKHSKDRQFFKKCEDYLLKVGEENRAEKGLGLWALIIVLMVIEASAFGYALAPYALTLATPNTAIAGAFGIGLVISVIALLLSELAGRQLYKNHMVSQLMSLTSLREKGQAGDYTEKDLINIDNTYADNDRPRYQQILHRLKVDKRNGKPIKAFGVSTGYAIFIVILAVAAFWVRTETLNSAEADLIANPPAVTATTDDFPVTSDTDFPMPEDMKAIRDQSENKSAQDQIDAMHRASLVTFAVLSSLFVFIQFTSTYLAYVRGFAGSKSKAAWEYTHGFANVDDFLAFHQSKARSIAVDAQQALAKLQAALSAEFHVSGEDNYAKESNKKDRTFERFVAMRKSKSQLDKTTGVIKEMLDQLLHDASESIKKSNYAAAEETITKVTQLQAMQPAMEISEETERRIKETRQALAIVKPSTAQMPLAPSPLVVANAEAEQKEVQVGATVVSINTVQPAPVVGAETAKPGFDPYAWGKLTGFEEEDLDYVANKKGVDLQLIHRAYKLQKLDDQTI